MTLPRIALTLGDVAGIGPEVVVRAWQSAELHRVCRPVVVGHPQVLERAIELLGANFRVQPLEAIDAGTPSATVLPCWNPTGDQAADVPPGKNDGRAGQSACEYISAAAAAALEGRLEAITTAPLSKAALRMAGLHYPGHTEILAELCGVRDYAMMLWLRGQESGGGEQGSGVRGQESGIRHALGVAHVTLHTSIRSVPELLSTQGILQKVRLLDRFLRDVGIAEPRVGVCALNPHAGEEGLFGDEEARMILPAVETAASEGLRAQGPLPADTLLKRAAAGEFDGVVAMYHDQGHIALKLIGWNRAVNVTLGLPIVRTSPSHGTAFDIAWQGKASGDGMLEAIRVAAKLASNKRHVKSPAKIRNTYA